MSTTFDGKKDFTAEVKEAANEVRNIAQNKGLDEAISFLLPLEKKCRINNDMTNLKEVNLLMVRLCKDYNDWTKLNSILTLINKRSAQFKTPLSSVVEEGMKYLDLTPSIDVKIELIKSLVAVCEGKIFVEGESAHLQFILAKIYENQGKILEACEAIQDVHVETFGSLSKTEKGNYILEQIRLNLLQKDYIRTAIHSRKMNLKMLEEEGFEKIKIQYYTMQIEFYTYEKNVWEICQAYYKIASTKVFEGFTLSDREIALESAIIFLLTSKKDNQQSDMLHRMKGLLSTTFKEINLNQLFVQAINLFTTNKIIVTPFPGQEVIESHQSFSRFASVEGVSTQNFIERFRKSIIEHNLRIVAMYYQQITMARLQQLVNLDFDTLESYLSELSFSGDLFLKIDRPAGIVTFQETKSPEEILTQWSNDIEKLMSLTEATCHLINREVMVHRL